jgi:phosphoserine phosphatase
LILDRPDLKEGLEASGNGQDGARPTSVSPPAAAPGATARPLCVDLDGTVIATDLLWEGLFTLIRSRPLDLLRLPAWLLEGKAAFKRKIAERANVEAATLPYRPEVVEFLKREHEAGRRLVLATAADAKAARAVAEHLGLFDEVLASDGALNRKGPAKLSLLTERFGATGFDYIGDSRADLPLWEAAGQAVVVRPGRRLRNAANRVCARPLVFERPPGELARGMVRAMRPHQWVKNILLAVPLVLSHQIFDTGKLARLVLGFVAFCLAASSIYIVNDLLDLRSDRKHAMKRHRPFAAGTVPIPLGVMLAFLLLAISLALAALLSPAFVGVLVLYLVLTTAYSLYLKRKMMLDVLCRAGLYTHRLLAGAVATSVLISPWLFAFSMFFFVSLAFVKRYTELAGVPRAEGGVLPGRKSGS